MAHAGRGPRRGYCGIPLVHGMHIALERHCSRGRLDIQTLGLDLGVTLERFLDRRESDPEGLYLMGRAEAGLGHSREATSMMQACIDAVKTAPAYKYRLEKRWLNEAQQFLRSQV